VPGVSASTARRRARAAGLQARRREIPAGSTIYKGSDDLRALFFACDPRATRGSSSPCCGCALARTPQIRRFPGQSRLFSLFSLPVRAAPTLARSTIYARRFIVTHGGQSSIERPQQRVCTNVVGTFMLPFDP